MLKPELVDRMEPGMLARTWRAQFQLLKYLMDSRPWGRMQEMAIREKNGYTPAEFISDVRKGLFRELDGTGPVKVDSYRIGLQSQYVSYLSKEAFEVADPLVKSVSLGALSDLLQQVKAAIPRSADITTRYHLKELQRSISEALDRKYIPAGWGNRGILVMNGRAIADETAPEDPETCWPDTEVSEGRH
jgi:hypothetical protein